MVSVLDFQTLVLSSISVEIGHSCSLFLWPESLTSSIIFFLLVIEDSGAADGVLKEDSGPSKPGIYRVCKLHLY